MPIAVDGGTVLQLVGMAGAGVAIWAAMRDQQTKLGETVRHVEKSVDRFETLLSAAVAKFEKRADRDGERISKHDRRITKLEALLAVKKHDSDPPPPSDEDEEG